ncbi:MAG: DUF2256 domain-containing protein [Proteobacteria bacterium]|nr:DUF2256 domain-containing protein [Pseudomonadota bacterium]
MAEVTPARRASGAPRPVKTCAHCGRPFEWRKKWARDWDQVKYCSDACRRGLVPRRIIPPS